jgi:chromosome segregation ATPase
MNKVPQMMLQLGAAVLPTVARKLAPILLEEGVKAYHNRKRHEGEKKMDAVTLQSLSQEVHGLAEVFTQHIGDLQTRTATAETEIKQLREQVSALQLRVAALEKGTKPVGGPLSKAQATLAQPVAMTTPTEETPATVVIDNRNLVEKARDRLAGKG